MVARRRRPRRSGAKGIVTVVAFLACVALTVAAAVNRSELQKLVGLRPRGEARHAATPAAPAAPRERERKDVAPLPADRGSPPPSMDRPRPPQPDRPSVAPERQAPEPPPTVADGPAPDAPMPAASDDRAAAEAQAAAEQEREAQIARQRAAAAPLVETSLRAAIAALREGDQAAARRAVDASLEAAGEAPDLTVRCERWRLLVTYAEELEAHRRKASESAAEGRDYTIGDRTIGIVELTPQAFAYKERGQTVRGPRRDLPKPIERAILREWFAGDGRAANHIFLGIDRLLETKPDMQKVRDEWETALRGEPATQALMPLLDDPAITPP